MQGVNVVARWIDPITGKVSTDFVASSVSGFRFRGNAGNSVSGFVDGLGRPYDRFGSDDLSLEGYFDLTGLEIPNGAASATYQITVEPVDPLFSETVGPYQPMQVLPSGVAQPLMVTIAQGSELQQDILMTHSAVAVPDWFRPQNFANPAAIPSAGDWTAAFG